MFRHHTLDSAMRNRRKSPALQDSAGQDSVESGLESLKVRNLFGTIAVFDDATYLDSLGGVGHESDTVKASRVVAGHTVRTFI